MASLCEISAGQLRKIDKFGKVSDEPFEFDVFQDQEKNQAHYEKLADVNPWLCCSWNNSCVINVCFSFFLANP